MTPSQAARTLVLVTVHPDAARAALDRILAEPTPDDLWQLQKALLMTGGEATRRARAVAQQFHACLRSLHSKSESRNASRWGAVLGTAAVASVTLPDMLHEQERSIQTLIQNALPAALEVGSAAKSAQAWEIEAGLIYDEFAWFLYEELWDLSTAERQELPTAERRERIDQLLDPLLDPTLPDGVRGHLVVDIFRAVLAARMQPLLDPREG
jgi:hypothetical protein